MENKNFTSMMDSFFEQVWGELEEERGDNKKMLLVLEKLFAKIEATLRVISSKNEVNLDPLVASINRIAEKILTAKPESNKEVLNLVKNLAYSQLNTDKNIKLGADTLQTIQKLTESIEEKGRIPQKIEIANQSNKWHCKLNRTREGFLEDFTLERIQ